MKRVLYNNTAILNIIQGELLLVAMMTQKSGPPLFTLCFSCCFI